MRVELRDKRTTRPQHDKRGWGRATLAPLCPTDLTSHGYDVGWLDETVNGARKNGKDNYFLWRDSGAPPLRAPRPQRERVETRRDVGVERAPALCLARRREGHRALGPVGRSSISRWPLQTIWLGVINWKDMGWVSSGRACRPKRAIGRSGFDAIPHGASSFWIRPDASLVLERCRKVPLNSGSRRPSWPASDNMRGWPCRPPWPGNRARPHHSIACFGSALLHGSALGRCPPQD
jgi:hypothetical protein